MTLSGARLAGHHPEGRPKNDFYPTPEWATVALIEAENIYGKTIWEPACGDGSMSDVLAKENRIIVSDIEPRMEGAKTINFLKPFNHPGVEMDWIITNPPFNICRQFVEQAKAYRPKKIAMFLKIQFLETADRLDLLLDKKFPLARVHIFSKRVTLRRNGESDWITLPNGKRKKKPGSTMCFAWFIWDKEHEGPASIGWV